MVRSSQKLGWQGYMASVELHMHLRQVVAAIRLSKDAATPSYIVENHKKFGWEINLYMEAR